MPLYNNTYPPNSIAPGEEATLVNNEQLGAGNFSQRVAIADAYGMMPRPIVLAFSYASAPAAVEYDIFVALDDNGVLSYSNVGKTTNPLGDQVTIERAAAGGPQFSFICVKEVISPGVNATATVQQ
jgi:hypothetical protein